MADDRRGGSAEDRRRSSVDPDGMGKARRARKPTKERWLLTRKTWKYMADAGRRLIPEGALNRPEDVPKIEAYFQEVCQREPKFLLWRKSSYPGAVGFRPHRRRTRTKGGSCRQASSADEAEEVTPPRKQMGNLVITQTSGGRFDVSKLKKDFLESSTSKDPRSALKSSASASGSLSASATAEDPDQKELIDMIQKYLNVQDRPPPPAGQPGFNYQDLIDKLQQHLALVFGKQNERERRTMGTSRPSSSNSHHEGDPVQRSLLDTLSRYYSRSPNRDHIIQDLLTDRKLLKKLYYDLRQTKGFRGGRVHLSSNSGGHSSGSMPQWRSGLHTTRRDEEYEEENDDDYNEGPWEKRPGRGIGSPPPLVEVQGETGERYAETGIQTDHLVEATLRILRAEAAEKKRLRLLEEEEAMKEAAKPDDKKSQRRRSSVDHDDVSQSVSDTIKRYLRMARKKSVDGDKADRFKRINYDKNLRNIKPKGEISKPGDDDGLNKGCQTEDDWLDTMVEVVTVDKGPSSFLSHLLHGREKAPTGGGSAPVSVSCSPTGGVSMQKSRSSSSVVQHVSRKIWRTRSKSRGPPLQASTWVPQGSCTWSDGSAGHQVLLAGAPLQGLAEAERRALRQAALARLRQLNLGVPVDIPDETAAAATHKPKRRAYLLKRKALTTGFLTKDGEKEKDSAAGGLVFGVPLSQCAEASRREGTLRRESARGSRSSFSSLLDRVGDESGSCESLASRDRLASSESELETPEELSSSAARVPGIVSCCLHHLRRYGMRTLGLFRVSTSKKRVRQLREEWDCGKEGPLDVDTCPHDVATLLKEFLRDLPDPLLCRDLYQAFLQTQRIRNRRLQQEALQLLVLLLPSAHQDTLRTLLIFLGEVADNCEDRQESSGEYLSGNKMDVSNLATVFAPNILHCIKPGSAGKEISAERAEDRIDVINVVRSLIELRDTMFCADAELRHEACLQLAATQPAILDALLGRMLAVTMRNNELIEGVQSGGADSDSQGSPPSQRRVWSREECLHQTAAMGGPNVAMTFRQRERERGGREARSSSKKRWREEQKQDSSSGSLSSTMTIITSRLRAGQGPTTDEQSVVYSSSKYSSKGRSDSVDSSDTNDGFGLRRRSSSSEAPVITASLRLPLSLALDDPDIPYIEEAGAQPTVPPRRRQRSISGSDSSTASQPITGTLSLSHVSSSIPAGYDSAVGSSATLSSPPRNLTPSSSSAGDGGLFSSPPSWASTPPTSPTSPPNDYEQFTARMSVPVKGMTQKTQQKDAPILQKVTITSTGEIQQKKMDLYKREISYEMQSNVGQKSTTKIVELPKSHSASSVSSSVAVASGQRRVDFSGGSSVPVKHQERESKYTPSISSIGGAVLRSKTADFERLLHLGKPESPKPTSKVESLLALDDKKKYTKRRYTDSRHQTRHIPDAETLDNTKASDIISTTLASGRPTPVYKRRELISSVQTKNK